MSENTEYFIVPDDKGSIRISEDVIASIASVACGETEGVAAMSASPQSGDFTEIFVKKGTARGIKVMFNENNTCDIDVSLLVKFGSPVTDVAKKVQNAVKSSIESMTGVEVTTVDVGVAGIAFQK